MFFALVGSLMSSSEDIEVKSNSIIELDLSASVKDFAPKDDNPLSEILDYTDEKISVIPDFISNCGMARVFGYLMGNDLNTIEDKEIFNDTSEIIKNALVKTYEKNPSKTKISKTAFEIALKQLI